MIGRQHIRSCFRRRRARFLAVAAAAVALLAAGCGGGGDAGGDGGGDTAAASFDEDRALADVVDQVELGPRPAGSERAAELAGRLRRRLPDGRIEPVEGGLRNVVGTLPGSEPAILVGAHYDTFDTPGFVGANDGASGVAVVLEVARALQAKGGGGREVRFVLFDGEEAPPGAADFLGEGVRGSRAYVAAHADEIGEVVIVDLVGDRDLAVPREAASDPRLWAQLRAAAAAVGAERAFPDETVGEILDDHTPFARSGVPAIDLIDFTFPEWHTTEDDLDTVSAQSLGSVGRTLVEYVMRRRAA